MDKFLEAFFYLATAAIPKLLLNLTSSDAFHLLGQLPRCLLERRFALGWNDISIPGLFTPECTTDGKYEKVQCHVASGFCWCSDKDGHVYSNTKVKGKPDCANLPGKR